MKTMKTNFGLKIFLFAATAILFAGCATHRVDWNARVGAYTFDQAVVELGPPDKQAKLSDGQTIAEWITRYSNGSSGVVGTGFYGRPGGVGIVQTSPSYYENKLRLTFGTNNVLSAWLRK
jgi:hypothetical protein